MEDTGSARESEYEPPCEEDSESEEEEIGSFFSVRKVFSYPNCPGEDVLSGIFIGKSVSLAVSSKGQALLFDLPDWRPISRKKLPGFTCCSIFGESSVVCLHQTRPILYNSNFQVIHSYKRPVAVSLDFSFSSLAISSDSVVASTKTGQIFKWDSRSDEFPQILTVSGRSNLSSLSICSSSLVAGTAEGRILIFDMRSLRSRVADFNLASIAGVRNATLDGISRIDESPWLLGYQFSKEKAGFFDLMSGSNDFLFDLPRYLSPPSRFTQMRPIMKESSIYIGCGWSNNVQCLSRDTHCLQSEVVLPDVPICFDGSEEWFGIFAATSSGDVFYAY